MKVSELTGITLDYWVAKGMGHYSRLSNGRCEVIDWNKPGSLINGERFEPSTDWQHAGPIIDREFITIRAPSHPHPQVWAAFSLELLHRTAGLHMTFYGSTPLIAAMRAYVATKFGDDVDFRT